MGDITTRIKGSWVVAWNGSEHEVVSDGACLIQGNQVIAIGKDAEIAAGDREVDMTGCLIMPGLINTHLHAGFNARDSVLLDVERRGVIGRNYLNWQAGVRGRPRFESDPESSITFGLTQCLLSGVTTAIEFGAGGNGTALLRAVERTGIRAYSGLSYRNATMFSNERGAIEYEWDDVEPKFQKALAFAEECENASERVRPILCPGHPDTCEPEILEKTREIAEERGWPVTIHAGLHLKEFERTYDMYGCSPYELLDRVGLLGPNVVIAHAIFHREHSLSMFAGSDLDLLGSRNGIISHAPVKFAHLGIQMESVQRYADAGISITMGTDTSNPADLICEMRQGMVASRVADRSFVSAPPRLMFDAATINAADALGRPDLGRLAPGTRADIVAVDLENLRFGAVHDPIRSLIECGSASDVKWVMVEGRVVVENGQASHIDEVDLLQLAQQDGRRTWEDIPNWYPAGRSIDEIIPPSYAMR